MFYHLFEKNSVILLILLLFIRLSFTRFVSEKNRDQIDRLSKDYFQERGLVLDDFENVYDQNDNDIDSDISLYFPQQSSLLYSLKNANVNKKLEPTIAHQNLPIAAASVTQDKLQQFNQEKLLQQIQQYKNELQRLRMPQVANFANNAPPLRNSMKQSQLYHRPESMMSLLNDDNHKALYNHQYTIGNEKPHTMLGLSRDLRHRPLYLNEQPMIDMSEQNE